MQGLRNKTLLFIVVISLLANIIMLVYFGWIKEQSHKNHNDRPNSPITVFLKKDIGFTDEQMGKFNQLRLQNRKKMKPLFEDIRLAKVQFYGYLNDQQINDSVLNSAATLIGEKQHAIDVQTFKNFREIRTICTEEQKKRYDSLVSGVVSKMWFTPRNSPPEEKRK